MKLGEAFDGDGQEFPRERRRVAHAQRLSDGGGPHLLHHGITEFHELPRLRQENLARRRELDGMRASLQ
jgi:hypothetical protein